MLSRPKPVDIFIKQGSNFSITITMNDSAGSPRDLNGYSGKSEIRDTRDSATVVQAITITILSPTTNGQLTATLTAAQTLALDFGNTDYVYDILLNNGSGVIETVMSGKAILIKDITEF
jgi:hypothetical protein